MSRPDALQYVEVATGDVLDTVTVAGERLRFTSGAAEQMFTVRRDRFGWSDAQTYDELTGWSNGYVALRPR